MRLAMTGTYEPGLQQWIAGGQRKERQADRDSKEAQQPQRGKVTCRRRSETLRDSEWKRKPGKDQKREMDDDGGVTSPQRRQRVRIGIAGKQHRLEKDHRHRPNGRG